MSAIESPRKAIILVRGIQEIKDGDRIIDYELKHGSQRCVDAVYHWASHQKEFTAVPAARIVLSGGYGRLTCGQALPPKDKREDSKIASSP